jgi:hypothetical protein
VVSDPRGSRTKRAALRSRKIQDAEERDQLRRLGLKAQTAARAESERDRLLDRLFEHAYSDNPRISIQALQIIMDRVLGKPLQGTVNLHGVGGSPQEMVDQLRAQLPDAEERRAIARARFGLSSPQDADVIDQEEG